MGSRILVLGWDLIKQKKIKSAMDNPL
jgi:hypothetical protein